ncbi:hypothetical protein [Streptomyces olivoreticuli]|uniref:hypothetical protein n=1 Tax=Streptomyces olivoreticuli TaxID=68246 RepID=UPI000E2808A3|nr:hypothetical protein [Streptomyces olivoreticuli]
MGFTKRAAVVPAAALAVLLSGCGGKSDPSSAPEQSAAAKAKGSGPVYNGGRLPGLARDAAWSAPKGDGSAAVIAVGESFAVVTGPSKAGPPSDEKRPFAEREGAKKVEFRDARSGTVRQTVNVDDGQVYASTWHGRPALRVESSTHTASDGLTAAKRTVVSDVYGADGKKLGRVDFGEHSMSQRLADGWVFRDDRAVGPAEGGAEHKLDGAGDVWRMQGPAGTGRDGVPESQLLSAGGYGFTWEEGQAGPFAHPKRLIVSELGSGKKAWTSQDAQRPDGAAPEDKADSQTYARPVTVVGDKLVVAWLMPKKDSLSSELSWVMGVHDIKTGRLLATGPAVTAQRVGFDTDRAGGDPFLHTVTDPATGLVAVSGQALGYSDRTTVFDVNTGKQVWTQDKDESELSPVAAGNGVLFGYTGQTAGEFHDPLAVDIKTKKVLAEKLDEDQVPVFSTDGHGAVALDDGIFVFPKG